MGGGTAECPKALGMRFCTWCQFSPGCVDRYYRLMQVHILSDSDRPQVFGLMRKCTPDTSAIAYTASWCCFFFTAEFASRFLKIDFFHIFQTGRTFTVTVPHR